MAKPAAGQVYFIRAVGTGLLKIGYTGGSVRERLRRLRATSPVMLESVALVAGIESDESRLHARFRDDWSHGEWFRESPALREYVAAHAEPWTETMSPFRPPKVNPTAEERAAAQAVKAAQDRAEMLRVSRKRRAEMRDEIIRNDPDRLQGMRDSLKRRSFNIASERYEWKEYVDTRMAFIRAEMEHKESLKVARHRKLEAEKMALL